jgi:hypothetical protein
MFLSGLRGVLQYVFPRISSRRPNIATPGGKRPVRPILPMILLEECGHEAVPQRVAENGTNDLEVYSTLALPGRYIVTWLRRTG